MDLLNFQSDEMQKSLLFLSGDKLGKYYLEW